MRFEADRWSYGLNQYHFIKALGTEHILPDGTVKNRRASSSTGMANWAIRMNVGNIGNYGVPVKRYPDLTILALKVN
jgi:hypothetical protein